MAAYSEVRYSTGDRPIGSAREYPGEYPVPRNKFWDDLEFVVGRNFLMNFSNSEIARLPIDPNSNLDQRSKYALLLKLLQHKILQRDEEAAPECFSDEDPHAWSSLWLGIYTMQDKLGFKVQAYQTLKMLVNKSEGPQKLSYEYYLADVFVENGRYTEAERLASPIVAWLDDNLGEASPQALGARRILLQAVWKQGLRRRQEAQDLLEELRDIIDEMDGGKFHMYQEEQKEVMECVISELQNEI